MGLDQMAAMEDAHERAIAALGTMPRAERWRMELLEPGEAASAVFTWPQPLSSKRGCP